LITLDISEKNNRVEKKHKKAIGKKEGRINKFKG